MGTDSKLAAMVVRLVEASRTRAAWVAAAVLALAAASIFITVRRAAIDTDTDKLLSPDLPWRRAEARMDREFPQNDNLLAVVVDGATPDQAEDATDEMAARLSAEPDLFRDVRQPDGSLYFRRNGLLFLSRQEVQAFADNLTAAQPMLGALAGDPSPRGVFDALDLFAQGAIRGEVDASRLDKPFGEVAGAVEASLQGRHLPLSWQNLLSDRKPLPRELRRFVLARPALNFGSVEPGRKAVDAVHAAAAAAGFTADRGVTVRVTGPVALSDDQLAALKEGAGTIAAAALGLLVFWLALAVRSLRAAAAILAVLAAGLLACAAFAGLAVGPFNPISVAFAPLFIGIAIDFGIQFSVRYAAETQAPGSPSEVFRRTASGVGAPLVVAGLATAAGFLSLVPTDYRGVSDLGLIAGVGMLIALALNLTLLPALLAKFRARGFRDAAGPAWAGSADRLLVRRRGWVLAGAALLAVLSALALPRLRFDFDPVNLENPRSESVSTLFDLMKDPDTTPYTLDILCPDAASAADLAKRVGSLPEVGQVIWLGALVPEDQQAKLEILADARDLLGPTLSPPAIRPAPTPGEVLGSVRRCAADLGKLGARGDAAAARLAGDLDRCVQRGPAIVASVDENLCRGAGRRLEDLRLALQAAPVTLGAIPPDVRRDWVGADGSYRVEVFPTGDCRNLDVLRRFVAAVERLAPTATGMPVGIQESAKVVVRAFLTAAALAAAAIAVLLAAVLRRVRDIAAVLAPLVLAGLLTLAAATLRGMSLNFSNIVALPLLLGIGVAFDIYFVLRWRAGEQGLLRSPTARGMVFSALTTGTAFGSLALSNSPGMADMGKLLSLGLFFTLVCTLLFLPAFLGAPPAPSGKGTEP